MRDLPGGGDVRARAARGVIIALRFGFSDVGFALRGSRRSAPHGVIAGADAAPRITDGGCNAIVRVDPKTRAVRVRRGAPSPVSTVRSWRRRGSPG